MREGLADGLLRQGGIGLRESLGLGRRAQDRDPENIFLRQLDFTGKVIYDVGAFEGIYTLFFARASGPGGHVVSFEPNPTTYERLVTNVRLNGFENVTPIRVGVATEPGELAFSVIDGGTGRMSADPSMVEKMTRGGADVETLAVPVTSLDRAIQEHSLAQPGFVKIDVEGLELAVLRGMEATIEAARPELFVELHGVGEERRRENAGAVAALLLDADYEVRAVEEDRPVASPDEAPLEGHLYAS